MLIIINILSSAIIVKPHTHDKVSLDKCPLDKFYLLVCTASMNKSFLDNGRGSKAGVTSFWTRKIVKEKLVNSCCTHKQMKHVKKNLVACTGLKTCPAVYTSKQNLSMKTWSCVRGLNIMRGRYWLPSVEIEMASRQCYFVIAATL